MSTTATGFGPVAPLARRTESRIGKSVRRAMAKVKSVMIRRAERRLLREFAEFDERLLADIGCDHGNPRQPQMRRRAPAFSGPAATGR